MWSQLNAAISELLRIDEEQGTLLYSLDGKDWFPSSELEAHGGELWGNVPVDKGSGRIFQVRSPLLEQAFREADKEVEKMRTLLEALGEAAGTRYDQIIKDALNENAAAD